MLQVGWVVGVQQAPPWQTPVAAQISQLTPLVPQAWMASPGWQTWLPSQQPVQLPVAQLPPQPSEAPAHLPPQFGVQLDPQTPLPQICEGVQTAQCAPPRPQPAVESPGWQMSFSSQQPLQLSAGQKPPQPSEAPEHLPVQLGVQASAPSVEPLVLPLVPPLVVGA